MSEGWEEGWESGYEAAIAKFAWLPIETAPQDGQEVLLFAQDPELRARRYYGVGSWAGADYTPTPDWFWPYAIRPTHWQPLPEPPQ